MPPATVALITGLAALATVVVIGRLRNPAPIWGWIFVLLVFVAVSFGACAAFASPKILDRVNREENAAHVFGAPYPQDHSAGENRGRWHCVNYAYAKRDRLIAAGVSPSDMRVIGVATERSKTADVDHAVLMVDTSDGEWVLDSRFEWPQRRIDLIRYGYHFSTIEIIDSALPMQAWWKAVFAASR